MELGYASYMHPHTGSTASIALHKQRQGYSVQVRVNRQLTETEQAYSEQEAQYAARLYQDKLIKADGMIRCS